MDAAVCVRYSLARIVVHARSPRVVVRIRIGACSVVDRHRAQCLELRAKQRAQTLETVVIVGATPGLDP